MATANPISGDIKLSERPAAELLVFVAAMPPDRFEGLLKNLADAFSSANVSVASQSELPENKFANLTVIPVPQSSPGWTLKPSDFMNAFEMAGKLEARAILILGPGADSLSQSALRNLGEAASGPTFDLAVPCYALPPHAGLINSAILYPLTRALFAARTRFPLAIDLGLSFRMAERLAAAAQRMSAASQDNTLLWPVNEAIAAGFAIGEVTAGPRSVPQPSEPDVNAILAFVTGSLFSDIEAKAAYWQRPRRPTPPQRSPLQSASGDGTADVPRMIEAFRLGYTNLLELWSLILPPNTLLLLKRLSALDASAFRMPENLWARIVYDFLIAYRQRTMNRGHVMGALIPLYLAWAASHINIVTSGTPSESHVEAVAAAFETDKPYLVARWRWPDRFTS